MMMHTAIPVCLAAATVGCTAVDNDLPKDVSAAFEKATEVTLYSLDPGHGYKGDDNFHGWKVLGKTTLKDDQLKKVWSAVEKGRKASNGMVAACFNPRHGLRVVRDKEVFDIVICFECLSATCYSGDKRVGSFLTTSAPGKVLSEVLTDAKVPLPKEQE